jgi:acyl-coenzyme A thioesterase PaaI-like protein
MSSAETPVPAFGVHIPFVELLGFQMKSFENGESEIHFTPKSEHTNSFAVAHGGAVMRPAAGPLIARGTLKHRTKTLAFAESAIYDASNQLCAHATGTFRYVVRRPVTADAPAQLSTD